MKLNIPFEKEIKFDTSIYEICSISLEHEITKNESELLGNFIFEGTYKENELSSLETPFNFIVPFTVEFNTMVDISSINFTIDNFTYDIKDNILNVKVDYIVEYLEKKVENREEETETVQVIEPKEDLVPDRNIKPNLLDDDFITYHVHIIKENETIESISEKYNIERNSIVSINPNIEINTGNKIIIPIENE